METNTQRRTRLTQQLAVLTAIQAGRQTARAIATHTAIPVRIVRDRLAPLERLVALQRRRIAGQPADHRWAKLTSRAPAVRAALEAELAAVTPIAPQPYITPIRRAFLNNGWAA